MVKSLIISAPSGSGKSTIVKYILNKYPQFTFSISATTRSKRINETDGVDYHFLSISNFKDKIKNNEFLEFEEVYDNQFYGTLLKGCNDNWNNNKILLFDMDVIGACKLKQKLKDESISCFIDVPIEIIKDRLRNRNTETEQKLNVRVSKSKKMKLNIKDKFDIIISNIELDSTFKEVDKLIQKFCFTTNPKIK